MKFIDEKDEEVSLVEVEQIFDLIDETKYHVYKDWSTAQLGLLQRLEKDLKSIYIIK